MTADETRARRTNPPIRGHELIAEGHKTVTYNPISEAYAYGIGGCRCGAKPPGWPDISANAVKRWHRQHKAELRAEADQ